MPPRRRGLSLRGGLKGHAVEVCKIRYWKVAPQLCPTLSGRAALLPSHIPSETILVGRTPDRARGPLFIFRKIHLYGKFKKSTHGHQTAELFRTQPCFAARKRPSRRPQIGWRRRAPSTKRKLPTLRWEIRTPRRSCKLPIQTSIRLKLPTLRSAE